MRKFIIILLLVALSNSVYGSQSKKTEPNKPIYAIWRVDNDQLLDNSRHDSIKPIASMTKLMTALVILRGGQNLKELLTVNGPEGSRHVRRGMIMSREDLLRLSLISSDNLATRTLAENYPGGYQEFIAAMNFTAKELGMNNTYYDDSTGLSAKNVSTPEDLKLLVLATSSWDIFGFAANTAKFVGTATLSIKNTIRQITINSNNTNGRFVGQLQIVSAKTGFTNAAGRCLTMLYSINGSQYLLVVMGSRNPTELYNLVKQLVDKTK